jgi:hypothetical protein
MHYAASHGNLLAVKKLIEAGAASQLSALDHASRTPFELALLGGENAVTEYLRENHAKSSEGADPISNTTEIVQPRIYGMEKDHVFPFWFSLGLFVAVILLTKVVLDTDVDKSRCSIFGNMQRYQVSY